MTVSSAEILQIHNVLITTDFEELQGKLKQAFPKVKETELKLMQKIAKHSSGEQFGEFLNSGHIPPVKLTDKEMEMVKGGFAPLVIAGFILLCLIIAS